MSFNFKSVRLNPLMSKERIIELRSAITREVFLHEALEKYIRRLVGATRPYHPEAGWNDHSPSRPRREDALTSALRRGPRRSAGAGSSRCGRCSGEGAPTCIRRTFRTSRSTSWRIGFGSARTPRQAMGSP